MSPFDTPDDPFYEPKYAWEARGDSKARDHTDWDIVETFKPRHRRLDGMNPEYALAWEDDPQLVAEYLAHKPRHPERVVIVTAAVAHLARIHPDWPLWLCVERAR